MLQLSLFEVAAQPRSYEPGLRDILQSSIQSVSVAVDDNKALRRLAFQASKLMIELKTVLQTRFLIPLVLATILHAAQLVTVTLHDGSEIKGAFAGGSADEIKVLAGGQTLTLKTASIDAVRFEPGPTTPAAPQAGKTAPVQAGSTIPANTTVVVRLIDSADSAHDAVGEEYRASLDQPIVSPAGQVVAPRGTDALIVLTNRQQSGHLAGKAELTLVLRSLTIHGKRYDVVSTDVVKASSSRTARSGKTIGGLAAAGAVIGAIAGGGRGAAIGAGSGATLGTLGQVFTSGQRVRVPSETRLTFRLQQPLVVMR